MTKSISNQLFPLQSPNNKYYLPLFLIWPFIAFLLALINYSQKESRKVVYIFFIYYGLTFVAIGGKDGYAYALRLQNNAQLQFSEFFNIIGGLYGETSTDFIEPLISFIVSRFTSDHSILFAVYAAIFGFFYLKSIDLLHIRYKENPGWNAWIFMALFTLVLPITSINGFRMWTASWIFFYGAINVILYRDARFFIFALASSLLHFSFLTANVILIIYFFAGNKNYIYLPIAIASFIIPNIMGPAFDLIAFKLGGALQNSYENYSNDLYNLSNKESWEQASWFLKLSKNLLFYYLVMAIIIIRLFFKDLMKDNPEKNLFSFLLLFVSFVNFGKGIAAFGSRFQNVLYLFATLYVFFYFVKLPGSKIHLLTLLGLFPILLHAAIVLRIGSETINGWIFSPGLGAPLFVPAFTLYELLF
ncbi:MAG: EpsG family protein [Bacteroidales bacterium]|nr:EpsG family protein [Bacteroidales bacterium]MCF8390264.1 EpsG family protein [Bacteroidales bacterium]